VIRPAADGTLTGPVPARLAVSAPRVDGILERGQRFRASLWGCGELAWLRFPLLPAPWRILPNLVEGAGFRFGLAQTRPVVALELRGGTDRVTWRGARRPQRGYAAVADAAVAIDDAGTEWCVLPWGRAALRREGRVALLALGEDVAEVRGALTMSPERVFSEADDYVRRCRRIELDDAVLGSMAVHALHAAFGSIKRSPAGGFAGVAAGPGYSLPARSYYRDGYWTLQAILPFRPQLVRDTLGVLAQGVHQDGEAPSAVITPGPSARHFHDSQGLKKDIPAAAPAYPHDWWRDHFDSPLLFGILAGEYEAAAADPAVVDAAWPKLLAIAERYRTMPAHAGVLPCKPAGNDRDWADNVYRTGLVTYDIALYHGFLRALAALAERREPALATTLRQRARAVRRAATEALWDPELGHYLEYRAHDGYVERHLALDTLTAIRFGLADDTRSAAVLAAVGKDLTTARNDRQPYGDWGVMACFPPYRRRRDTRGKSAFPFRYHNGADWPYLDGLYAGQLLQRDDPSWRYPLTRWWRYGLAQGWPAPVEYYSPPFGAGAPLQAWSAMPAAAMVQDGFGVRPPYRLKAPPFGDAVLRDVSIEGRRRDLVSQGGELLVRPA